MTKRTKAGLPWLEAALGLALLWLPLVARQAGAEGRGKDQVRRGKTHPRIMEQARARGHARASGQVEMVDVIVRYKSQPGSAEKGRVRGLGSEVRREFKHLRMMALRVPAHRLERLAEHFDVEFVDPDSPVEATSMAAKKTARLPGLPASSEDDSDSNKTATPSVTAMPDVAVAVIDSGVADHWDYNVAGRFDCTTEYGGCVKAKPGTSLFATAADTYDPYGHGTHVAGIIGGTGKGKSPSEAGIAPWAPIYSLRVLDGEGRGVASDVIAALDWVLDNATTHDIRVVNLSLGTALEESAAGDPLVQAVEALWDAGIVVVCSAGNYGRDGTFTITSPGNSPKVITVGSLTDGGTGDDFGDDYVSTYSSRGPTLIDHYLKPDLLAPGNRVVAPIATGKLKSELPERVRPCRADSCSGKDYLELSGTSMAAAMVSGAVALMISQEPYLNPASVKARLMRSARKIPGDPNAVGAGVLDITAALMDQGWTKRSPSPRLERSEEGPVLPARGHRQELVRRRVGCGLRVERHVRLVRGLRLVGGLSLVGCLYLVRRLRLVRRLHLVRRLYLVRRLHLVRRVHLVRRRRRWGSALRRSQFADDRRRRPDDDDRRGVGVNCAAQVGRARKEPEGTLRNTPANAPWRP